MTTAGRFSAGTPERLFETPPEAFAGAGGPSGHHYTATPDGQKFIIVENAEAGQAKAPAIQVTENWYEEFRNREQN